MPDRARVRDGTEGFLLAGALFPFLDLSPSKGPKSATTICLKERAVVEEMVDNKTFKHPPAPSTFAS